MEENLFNKTYVTKNLSERIHLHVIINFHSVNFPLFQFYLIFTLNWHDINWAVAWKNIHNDVRPASALSYQSSLRAQRVAKDPSFVIADIEDSDQTGRTCHFVCPDVAQLLK